MKYASTLALILIVASSPAMATEKTPPPTATGHADHAHMDHGAKAPATPPKAFTGLDANKDGFLSATELSKHPKAAHATMVDANKDGRLSLDEFKALEGM